VDPKLIAMNFYSDGELVSTATSASVMGNPGASVAWLANKLSSLGEGLHAGQVVMPGSLVAAVDAKPGRVVRAEFSLLGPVEVRVR
jgi:2-keto-4-pentenoate hydratase